ncbi:MAG: asparaginase [Chloroflexi bacterium]|nr:asparaginase [Chloroflexota bacterium]
MRQPRLIVHGGAWNIPDDKDEAHIQGVQTAIAHVWPQLQLGMSALDAVEAAVGVMEEDPTFDAGRGSFLNANAEIELDAIIMDGATLNLGAVAAIQNVLHPVRVARLVMERTEHCLLVGVGAQAFARRMGVPVLDPRELLTPRELAFYEKIKDDPSYRTRDLFEPTPMGTVGAVAMDQAGNLAAATSTGGTARKLPGRVGDSPLAGAGAYADNSLGATSATGWGEAIMKVLLSKTACDLLRNHPAMVAAEMAVDWLYQRVQGHGGLILMDREGRYGWAHNTPKMAFAYVDHSNGIVARMKVSTW